MSAPSRRYSASANDSAAIATSWPKASSARGDFGRSGTQQMSPAVSDKPAFYSKDRRRREIAAAIAALFRPGGAVYNSGMYRRRLYLMLRPAGRNSEARIFRAAHHV